MLVPKLLLTSIKIRIFGPKTAKIWSKICIFGHFRPNIAIFLHILSYARPKNNVSRVLRWVFLYVGNKTFDFSSKKKDFLPKNDQIWPIWAVLVNWGQAMQAYSMPCWWVGVWLCRGPYLARHLFTLSLPQKHRICLLTHLRL